MQKSTPNRPASRLWRRLAAAALAVPVAVAFAASGASAVESEPEAAEDSEQLPLPIPDPGLPVPGDPGDDPASDLIGQLGECVAALVETVVGAVSGAGGDVPLSGEDAEQLPPLPGGDGAADGLQPCLELLTALGLPLDLPVDLPVPLEDPAVKD
ncbi:hypothetical protein [Glycomyces salinus]|uniref:hypothetical protein n=1 Tax=Glycomyces salinus TaxID=980294 RepID=UPI0018EA40E2|nr:hypothetical protein [Glycomyces salinus]